MPVAGILCNESDSAAAQGIWIHHSEVQRFPEMYFTRLECEAPVDAGNVAIGHLHLQAK